MQEPPFITRDRAYTFADYQSPIYNWFANGIGVDFAGCTATLAFRVSPADPAPLFEAATITLATGAVSYVIARASFVGVTAPIVHGDLLITMSLGQVVEFAHIDLEILQGSTF